jgi:hypothetical protein
MGMRAVLLDEASEQDTIRLVPDEEAGEAAGEEVGEAAGVGDFIDAGEAVLRVGSAAAGGKRSKAGRAIGGAASGAASGAALGAAAGSVIPGIGTAIGTAAGAIAGLVGGLISSLSGSDPVEEKLKRLARRHPARYAADLVLYQHDADRYRALAHRHRLPSERWGRMEADRTLARRLAHVHQKWGSQLANLYGDRPMADRVVLGFAAATGCAEDIAAALDALRMSPAYPHRATFRQCVVGLTSEQISRIATAFAAGPEAVTETYRAVRHEASEVASARRRELLQLLLRQWRYGGPRIVPIFERITRRYSPGQAQRLRLALDGRGGDIHATFHEIERANARLRIRQFLQAFTRWLIEWTRHHTQSAVTPFDEPHNVVVALPAGDSLVSSAANEGRPSEGRLSGRPSWWPRPRRPRWGHPQWDRPRGARFDEAAEIAARHAEAEHERMEGDRDRLEQDRDRLESEHERMEAERDRLEGDRDRRESEREGLDDEPELLDDDEEDEDDEDAGAPLNGKPKKKARKVRRARRRAFPAARPRVTVIAGASPASSEGSGGGGSAGGGSGGGGGSADNGGGYGRVSDDDGAELDEEEDEDDTSAPWWFEPPRPAVMAADRVVPFSALARGFTPEQVARLHEGWARGRAAAAYHEILRERLRALRERREARFVELLQAAGCAPDGRTCALRGGQLEAFAPIFASYTPEQVERLALALRGGANPLVVFRQLERENERDRVLMHTGSFARYLGGWSAVGAPNPAAFWLQASRVREPDLDTAEAAAVEDEDEESPFGGEEAGSIFDDISGAVSSVVGSGGDGGGLGDLMGKAASGFTGGSGGGPDLGAIAGLAGKALGALSGGGGGRSGGSNTPQIRLPHWRPDLAGFGRYVQHGLLSVGLPKLATASPSLLLGMVPPLSAPRSGFPAWWTDLTKHQGLPAGDVAQLAAVVRRGSLADLGTPTLAYRRLLAQQFHQLSTTRERVFRAIHGRARKLHGPSFDPGQLKPNPYFLLFRHLDPQQVMRLRDVMLVGGDVIGTWRAIERQDRTARIGKLAGYFQRYLRASYANRVQRAPGRPAQPPLPVPSALPAWPSGPSAWTPAPGWFSGGDAGDVAGPAPDERRPRPLYHLQLPPMPRSTFATLLRLVPGLRAHPERVLAEAAGIVGQAEDVSGVDPTRGEYVMLPGETYRAVAQKLVGDPRRARELQVANPARDPANPRVKLPPTWFGFIHYAVPAEASRRRSRRVALDTGDPGDGTEATSDYGQQFSMGGGGGGSSQPSAEPPSDYGQQFTSGGGGGAGGGEQPSNVEPPSDYGQQFTIHNPSPPPGYGEQFTIGQPSAPATEPQDDPGLDVEPFANPTPDLPGLSGSGFTEQTAPEPVLDPSGGGASPEQVTDPATAIASAPSADPSADADPFGGSASGSSASGGSVETFTDPGIELAASPIQKTAGGSARPNLTQRVYTVVQGDYPQGIAKKLGAYPARSTWWRELKRANPQHSTNDDGNWTALYAGDVINIPDEWPPSPLAQVAPGKAPTPVPTPENPGPGGFPPVPIPGAPTGPAVPTPAPPQGTVPAGASVDPGTILRVQGELAAWSKLNPGACTPSDFGATAPFSPDLTGVVTPRTQQALASFQGWHNARGDAPTLRTDGLMDPATIAALDAWANGQLGQLGKPNPSPGQGQGGSAPGLGGVFQDLGQQLGGLLRGAQQQQQQPPGAPPVPVPQAPIPRAPVPMPELPMPPVPQVPMPQAPIPMPPVPVPQAPYFPAPQAPPPYIPPAPQPPPPAPAPPASSSSNGGSAVPVATAIAMALGGFFA